MKICVCVCECTTLSTPRHSARTHELEVLGAHMCKAKILGTISSNTEGRPNSREV
jgi:hypothetical protein